MCALGVVPLVGCSETGGAGGSAGAGGAGGTGGTGGTMPPKACINDDDLAIICDYEFVDTARECGIDASFDCRPGQDDVVAQCVAANSSECVQVATGLGAGLRGLLRSDDRVRRGELPELRQQPGRSGVPGVPRWDLQRQPVRMRG